MSLVEEEEEGGVLATFFLMAGDCWIGSGEEERRGEACESYTTTT